MGLREWVRDLLFPPMVLHTLDQQPAHTFDTFPRPVDQVITSMATTGWGAKVTRAQALSVPAVLRGRNELCAIATLPLRQYRGLDIIPSALLRQLDLNTPNVVVLSQTIEDLILESLAWWEVVGRDFNGYPIAVQRIDPGRISLHPPTPEGGNLAQTPGNVVAATAAGPTLWLDGKPRSASDFVRFDSPNPGLLQAGARIVKRALLLGELAAVFADNPRPLDYFTDSDRSDVDPLSDDEVTAFLSEWQQLRKRTSTGWVPGAVQRIDVATPSPVELQLVELQRQATLELANALGVDAEDLGVSTTSRTYFNAVDRRQEKVNKTYAPYMRAITDRLSMGDVTPRGYEVRFDLADYLKADPATQVTYWRGLYDMDAITSGEVRAAAGFTGAPPAKPAAAPPATPPAVVHSSRPALTARADRSGAFDAAPGHTFAAGDFAADTPPAKVDSGSRTITGLALPYGATTQRYGTNVKFAPGSLEYGDVTRVKHLQDHTTPVGSVVSLDDTSEGLSATLSVLGGPDGSPVKLARDQLLHDAAAGLYDGLSVGVDFSMYPEDGDVEYDADTNTYTVVRATLREITTTPLPAFTDARVTKVAASQTGGTTVHCQHCGKPHAPGIACATFAAQLAQQTPPPAQPQGPPVPAQPSAPPAPPQPQGPPQGPADVAATFALLAQQLAAHGAQGGPVLVDPTGRQLVQVHEPSPYRFDRRGNLRPGSHDFSSDLVKGWKDGDQGARDRAESFLREAFDQDSGQPSMAMRSLAAQDARQEFAITPANVVNLNYPQNRPDLYVDQLDYLYPLYNGTLKGNLDVVTPFVIPKFNSSSGLVADHVTGTEPTPGAFTATAQTITPSAVSGKVEITREAFDQGGNPQMSGLIWRQMVRGWYEALEAYVQAQLIAAVASIPDLVVGVSIADAVLDAALAAAFVPLQYIRGGDRYRLVFTQVDLFTAMVKAKDTTGRRLYPSLGAMNAVGTADPGYNSIEAHGKLFVPAWATEATSASLTRSWMFDPDVVCLWASAPQRIDLQWRVAWVDLGIWGYKAFGVTDFSRTREVQYTR